MQTRPCYTGVCLSRWPSYSSSRYLASQVSFPYGRQAIGSKAQDLAYQRLPNKQGSPDTRNAPPTQPHPDMTAFTSLCISLKRRERKSSETSSCIHRSISPSFVLITQYQTTATSPANFASSRPFSLRVCASNPFAGPMARIFFGCKVWHSAHA